MKEEQDQKDQMAKREIQVQKVDKDQKDQKDLTDQPVHKEVKDHLVMKDQEGPTEGLDPMAIVDLTDLKVNKST